MIKPFRVVLPYPQEPEVLGTYETYDDALREVAFRMFAGQYTIDVLGVDGNWYPIDRTNYNYREM